MEGCVEGREATSGVNVCDGSGAGGRGGRQLTQLWVV